MDVAAIQNSLVKLVFGDRYMVHNYMHAAPSRCQHFFRQQQGEGLHLE